MMNIKSTSKRFFKGFTYAALVLCLVATLFFVQSSTIQASVEPSIGVLEVVPNGSVTLSLSNLPKNTHFYVQMGERGTGGIGGYHSASFDTGSESYSAKTFSIPTALKDEAMIDVRITTETYATVASTFFVNVAPTVVNPIPSGTPGVSTGIPTTSIKTVEPGESVTLVTHNFPENKNFVATMGLFGTRGVGGVEVGQFNSAGGGSFELTFEVPDSLVDEELISIRLQTSDGYYYAFDWFRNIPVSGSSSSSSSSTTTSGNSSVNAGYAGYPTTTILSVDEGTSVQVKVYNLPKETDFIVTIGEFGTRGIGGVKVDEFDSGDGGTQTFTFDVPTSLKDEAKLAIRLDSGYWYAFDWFVNSTSPSTSSSSSSSTTTTTSSTWGKIPSTSFVSLNSGNTVTFMAYNFEPDTEWRITMGNFGTRGVNGVYVKTITSASSSFSITVAIPSSLQSLDKIAIRFEQVDGPYYAYDWFANN